jgi:hypothetical protein
MLVSSTNSVTSWQRTILADFLLPCDGVWDFAEGIQLAQFFKCYPALPQHFRCGLRRRRRCGVGGFEGGGDFDFSVAQFRGYRKMQGSVGVGFQDDGNGTHAGILPSRKRRFQPLEHVWGWVARARRVRSVLDWTAALLFGNDIVKLDFDQGEEPGGSGATDGHG